MAFTKNPHCLLALFSPPSVFISLPLPPIYLLFLLSIHLHPVMFYAVHWQWFLFYFYASALTLGYVFTCEDLEFGSPDESE